MKKLIVLSVPLLALAACGGGGEAGSNAQANGTEAANAAGGANETAPAGNETAGKPTDGDATGGEIPAGKPTDGNAAGGATGGKPGAEGGNEQ